MKKTFIAMSLVVLAVSGCSVNNSDRIDFDPNKISYHYDQRTKMCFATTASRKFGSADTTGLGMANVECTDEVMNLANAVK